MKPQTMSYQQTLALTLPKATSSSTGAPPGPDSRTQSCSRTPVATGPLCGRHSCASLAIIRPTDGLFAPIGKPRRWLSTRSTISMSGDAGPAAPDVCTSAESVLVARPGKSWYTLSSPRAWQQYIVVQQGIHKKSQKRVRQSHLCMVATSCSRGHASVHLLRGWWWHC
jgi:hypothetical protein